jgi:ectoine hydroxylase-related dioxygenase (phytanoyl-CoA dioxygenase family)
MNSNIYNHQKEIKEKGYTVVSDILTQTELEHYRNLLERDCEIYTRDFAKDENQSAHGLNDKSLEKVVYNVHNKDLSWHKLFNEKTIIEIIEPFLKEGSYKNSEPFYMYNNSARCPLKGNKGQQLHLDSRVAGGEFCLVMNVLWVLNDFTTDNGATRIYPGSHKFNHFSEDGKHYKEEKIITAKAGSALIFNASLWHGGGPNTDGSDRWALALGYARWFIKPAFDYMQNTPPNIFDKLTTEQKEMLGFNSVPPKDEFTRRRRRSLECEKPSFYKLPNNRNE